MTRTIPDEMKAICVADDQLRWQTVDRPRPGPGEVLVRAHATAVNRADLLQRAGRYPVPPGASPILGLEVAGEIVALGEGVQRWSLGQRVCALLAGGGYAELVACHGDVLLAVPPRLSWTQAAALPEVLYTAYLNLVIEAGLQPGERVLVHAGASGVGTMAIQLCRELGSPVYATASAGKLRRLVELGADAAIDRAAEDFVTRIKELTAGRGVEVILDPVGAAYLRANLSLLARGGRMVVIGLLGGSRAEIDLGRLLINNQRVVGSVLRSRSLEQKAQITRQIEQRVWPLVAEGKIEAVIDRVLPIERADEAHALLKTNQTVGKVVLEITR
jgi:putative PIG3 family NAD(P)H quinone oxidoreductase